jgi:hypothetical protein
MSDQHACCVSLKERDWEEYACRNLNDADQRFGAQLGLPTSPPSSTFPVPPLSETPPSHSSEPPESPSLQLLGPEPSLATPLFVGNLKAAPDPPLSGIGSFPVTSPRSDASVTPGLGPTVTPARDAGHASTSQEAQPHVDKQRGERADLQESLGARDAEFARCAAFQGPASRPKRWCVFSVTSPARPL